MKKIFKNIIAPQLLAVILLMSISNLTYSQNKPQFIKNKGQFHTNINFKLEHQAGNIYFEKNRIKYDLYEKDKINAVRHGDTNYRNIYGHRFEGLFIGSNENVGIIGKEKISSYQNYFIGEDTSKWQ